MNRVELDFAAFQDTVGPWRLHCWGDFAVSSAQGEDVTPRSRKGRALLAWLSMHPDRPVSRERLCGLLWGDRGEEQARASLRQALFELRPFSEGERALLGVTRAAVTLHGDRLESDLDGAGLRHLPHDDEPLFANLDDIDEAFDNWLRATRVHERQILEARRSQPLPPHADAPPALAASSPPRPVWQMYGLVIALLLALATMLAAF